MVIIGEGMIFYSQSLRVSIMINQNRIFSINNGDLVSFEYEFNDLIKIEWEGKILKQSSSLYLNNHFFYR